MLAGRRAFDGETVTDVLAAVLTREPDWEALPAGIPTGMMRVLRRCLEKDPRRRLRDAGDARWMLQEEAREEATPSEGAAPRSGRRAALPWAVSGVLGLALAAALMPTPRGDAGSAGEPTSLAVRLPADTLLNVADNVQELPVLSVSPDGRLVAFIGAAGGQQALYVRSLDGFEARRFAGTEGASTPFFSPDGRWIGFFAKGMLKKVSTAGGRPVDLCTVGVNRGAAWGPSDIIVFAGASTAPLQRIRSSGGTPESFTQLDASRNERTHRWPVFLPGGREVAFTVGVLDKPGDYDDARIDAVSLETGTRRTLVQGASMARVAGDHLVLGRQGAIYAVPIARTGENFRITSAAVVHGVGGVPASGVLHFDVSGTGTLVYAEGDPDAERRQLVWLTRDGQVQPLPLPEKEYRTPRVSPDGRRFLVALGPGQGRASEIWVHDTAGGSSARLTFDEQGSTPVWTPDGRQVTYTVIRPDGAQRLMLKAADGSDAGQELMVFPEGPLRVPVAWAPDRRHLLFVEDSGPGRQLDIVRIALPGGAVQPLAVSPAVEWAGSLSPDGEWVAYTGDASGRPEVYVQPFSGSGGKWQVSEGGGAYPRWSPDGTELIYINGLDVMAVTVAATPGSFRAAPSRQLFSMSFLAGYDSEANYDVAPDGRILAVRGRSGSQRADHFNVVLNWADHLERGASAP
jgi:serine/threonine-protein kinase